MVFFDIYHVKLKDKLLLSVMHKSWQREPSVYDSYLAVTYNFLFKPSNWDFQLFLPLGSHHCNIFFSLSLLYKNTYNCHEKVECVVHILWFICIVFLVNQ